MPVSTKLPAARETKCRNVSTELTAARETERRNRLTRRKHDRTFTSRECSRVRPTTHQPQRNRQLERLTRREQNLLLNSRARANTLTRHTRTDGGEKNERGLNEPRGDRNSTYFSRCGLARDTGERCTRRGTNSRHFRTMDDELQKDVRFAKRRCSYWRAGR